MNKREKPLYRKVNTRTHGVRHGGGKAKWDRRTKGSNNNPRQASMHPDQKHGLDYTPLYRFLQSKVGQSWDDISSAALPRIQDPDALHHIVYSNSEWNEAQHIHPTSRVGATSYFNNLFIDDENRLQVVDKAVTPETMRPMCACCTTTLNGVRVTQPYEET